VEIIFYENQDGTCFLFDLGANAWLGGSLATFKLPKSPYQLFA
jgi:hypothetical protein